ncbi:MAG: low-specificity L-threonine aldolase [Pseudomonadota bacterium]
MYAEMASAEGVADQASIIDFRSDTVTRPSEGMREAMANAMVGDDVYGDDPTVSELEQRVAALMGKEAALFVASGTQSNLIALLSHCQRGEEYIAGKINHISYHEAGGAAVLGGISPCHLEVNERGGITANQVEAALKPDDSHHAISRLVCVENTVNGMVQDQSEIGRIAEVARANGLSVHLDGARLMNAVAASNHSAKSLVDPVDSVSLCLSKGLGAPVGSVLSGSEAFIRKARRNRKMVGGGMRQSGVLAACGLYALEHNAERMRDDHARARRLAEGLTDFDALRPRMDMLDTNMVFVEIDQDLATALQAHLKGEGILISGASPMIRIVVHLDIDDEKIDRLLDAIDRFFKDRAV